MKIAIDCRYIGKSGIGRVCEGILENLDFTADEFYLIGNDEILKKYNNCVKIPDDTDPYSKSGLLKFNKKRINKECDCIIIPNFLIPFGIKIPVHSIMHDLIFLDLPEITTRGFADYRIKKYLLKRCMKKSKSVACVSEFTKSRCAHYYKKLSEKCYVNYNGLSKSVLEYDITGVSKENKIIYVGNVKPHKGLKTLIQAYKQLPQNYCTLKIIGEKEKFLTGMKEGELDCEGIVFTGRLGDDALLNEIASAKYLIQPSLYEGFGLTPLEALYLGTQPIVSDIEVFKEVYNTLPVVFFQGADRLKEKITEVPENIDCRKEILIKFSFEKFVGRLMSHLTNAAG